MDATTVVSVAALGFVAWRLSRMVLGKTNPTRARELVRAGATLLDVRTAGEFGSGHLDGARHIPLHELGARMGELGPKDRPVVLYCASGVRSASAAGLLRRGGFAQVFDLGAMSRWPR